MSRKKRNPTFDPEGCERGTMNVILSYRTFRFSLESPGKIGQNKGRPMI